MILSVLGWSFLELLFVCQFVQKFKENVIRFDQILWKMNNSFIFEESVYPSPDYLAGKAIISLGYLLIVVMESIEDVPSINIFEEYRVVVCFQLIKVLFIAKIRKNCEDRVVSCARYR